MDKVKPSKLSRARNENEFLRALVNRLIFDLGATKFEMERLLDEGGKESPNTALIRKAYTETLTTLGIESIDPREAAREQAVKPEVLSE